MKNRLKNTKDKIKNFFIKFRNKDTSFFIIALCVLLLSTALIWRYTSNPDEGENLVENDLEDGNINVNLDPYEDYIGDVMEDYANANQTGDEEETGKIDLKTMKVPLDGEVIKEYTMDSLVYFDAIGEWRVHKGVDIKPKDSLIVESAFEGKIEAVNSSELTGTEIIIDHGNNIRTLYNNLASAQVSKGDVVEKGQKIGNVGKCSSIESADGPHLHFELIVNGKNVDPFDYIPGE